VADQLWLMTRIREEEDSAYIKLVLVINQTYSEMAHYEASSKLIFCRDQTLNLVKILKTAISKNSQYTGMCHS